MYYVYRFLDKDNEIIYVGKTYNLETRLKTHFGKKGHLPKECYQSVTKVEYIELENEIDMPVYELYYINIYNPKYNKKDHVANLNSDIINFNKHNSWINYNELDKLLNPFLDINTLDLDEFVGKIMFENTYKRIFENLGEKAILIKTFHKKLEQYGLVGDYFGTYRFYLPSSINHLFKEYKIPYQIIWKRSNFNIPRNRTVNYFELIKL